MIMSVVTFLKKDELAFKIYKAIWENRNIRIVPKNPHFFNRFCIVKPDTEVFIYSGRLYIVCGYSVVINHPAEQPKFSEEEIELLFQDLCVRLPYGVKAKVLGWDEENEEEVYVDLRVYSINTDGYVYFESNDYDVDYVQFDDCQLYLRPMSSMTKEEKNEYEHIATGIEVENGVRIPNVNQIDWLNAHHFDYRGLIEKDLAIKITEDNNPYL
jgi:hypothetical protein